MVAPPLFSSAFTFRRSVEGSHLPLELTYGAASRSQPLL